VLEIILGVGVLAVRIDSNKLNTPRGEFFSRLPSNFVRADQVKKTTNTSSSKSDNWYVLPSVAGNLKSGAFWPICNVKAIIYAPCDNNG